MDFQFFSMNAKLMNLGVFKNKSMVPLTWSWIVMLVFLMTCMQKSWADSIEDAKSYYALGQAQFEEGQFSDAIASFQQAEKYSPAALMDYNIAICFENLGDKVSAVRHYEKFLERTDDEVLKSEVQALLIELKKDVENPKNSAHRESSLGEFDDKKSHENPRMNDESLSRVQSIDVQSIRDQRRYLIEESDKLNSQPPRSGVNDNLSKATEQSNLQVPANEAPKPKSKPIYKRWFFWLVVAVAAYVVIDIANSDFGDTNVLQTQVGKRVPQFSLLKSGGATLFQF